MRSVFRPIVLLVALLMLPVSLFAEPAKTGKMDEAAVRAKLLAGATIEGKLTKVEVKGDDKELVLTYAHQNKTPKKGGPKKYLDAVARYNAALEMRNTSLDDIKKLKAEVESAAKESYDIEDVPVNFELKINEKTVVRFTALPPNPDGTPKAMSRAELEKLKGDPRLPGYAAKLSDLNKTDIVRVTIDKKNIKKTDDGSIYPATMIQIVPTKPEDEFKPIAPK
jgi:hypothetical protein